MVNSFAALMFKRNFDFLCNIFCNATVFIVKP